MDITGILTLVFGLTTTILGVLLKAEYDKRIALQQQVAEHKRAAYESFSESINDFLLSTKTKDPSRSAEQAAKHLVELRHRMWQYSSDDVIKAYGLWQQCIFFADQDHDLSSASLIFMADLIVKMRQDLGLSKRNSMAALDILRIYINDIELKYDGFIQTALKFRKKLAATKHLSL